MLLLFLRQTLILTGGCLRGEKKTRTVQGCASVRAAEASAVERSVSDQLVSVSHTTGGQKDLGAGCFLSRSILSGPKREHSPTVRWVSSGNNRISHSAEKMLPKPSRPGPQEDAGPGAKRPLA